MKTTKEQRAAVRKRHNEGALVYPSLAIDLLDDLDEAIARAERAELWIENLHTVLHADAPHEVCDPIFLKNAGGRGSCASGKAAALRADLARKDAALLKAHPVCQWDKDGAGCVFCGLTYEDKTAMRRASPPPAGSAPERHGETTGGGSDE